MDTKIFEKLLKYVTSAFASSRGQNVLKFASKNRAYYHIQSLFSTFIVEQMEAEIKKNLPTASTSISVSMDQVRYIVPFTLPKVLMGKLVTALITPNCQWKLRNSTWACCPYLSAPFMLALARTIAAVRGQSLRQYQIFMKKIGTTTLCHIVTLMLQEACILNTNLSPCLCPCPNQWTWSCHQLDAWPQNWLSPRWLDVNVTSHSGDLILFSRHQYHRTGTPAVFNTTNKNGPPKKTKPNLRFHLMFSTESVDITAESEETVSLHPSFTPVANTSKIPAKKVQRRSKRILERTR